jgi:hypothetical protein
MRFTELVDIAKEKTGGFGGDKLTELADSVNSAIPIITQAGSPLRPSTPVSPSRSARASRA